MNSLKFLLIDSGIGGLNVLYRLATCCRGAGFLYLSDGAFVPYGEKSREFLCERSASLVEKHSGNLSGVILACNTLSTVCLDYIRSRSRVPVFGVFPQKGRGKTLLLCTAATKKSDRVRALESRGDLFAVSPKGLVTAIEDNVSAILSDDFSSVRSLLPDMSGFDSVSLGCTHFIYLKRLVQKMYRVNDVPDGVAPLVSDLQQTFRIFGVKLTQTEIQRNLHNIRFIGDDKEKNKQIFAKIIKTSVLN